MNHEIPIGRLSRVRREGLLKDLRDGPLAGYVAGEVSEIPEVWTFDSSVSGTKDSVLSAYRLQDVADYRGAIRGWFELVRPGGTLVIVVPHAFLYERGMTLPSRWDRRQRRLYTPASLLLEVEEALVPNSYRVRCLEDADTGFDYSLDPQTEPTASADLLLVLERIEAPSWSLGLAEDPEQVRGDAPDYEFERPRTRIQSDMRRLHGRILIMKLDHLGDFIMGISALERARAIFAESHITLLVGSWNVDMAASLGVADEVIAFDAFPRNSTEEAADVNAMLGMFRAAVKATYDLAVDLRTDTDTRILLREVSAPIKAGIGTRSQFPFIDIFLPLDFNRNEPETAREERLNHHAFASQGAVKRGEHRMFSDKDAVQRDCAIVWGPYHRLRPGQYVFEPWLELGTNSHGGLLRLDIGLDQHRVADLFVSSQAPFRLSFQVERPGTEYEFRIWAVDDAPSIDFSFFGGRLLRQGAESVLHQSEYLRLLIELVAMRVARNGMLGDVIA